VGRAQIVPPAAGVTPAQRFDYDRRDP
jgi:hypothetical protein